MQKHHKRLLNHTRITPAQQEPSCRPGKPPGTHTKLDKDQTLVVAQPCLPQTTFSKLQTKPKHLSEFWWENTHLTWVFSFIIDDLVNSKD